MDIVEYLQSKRIDYIEEGSDVGKNTANINCPFCPPWDPDPLYHLSVHLTKPIFSCWRCKTQGHISKLIYKLEGKKSKSSARIVLNKLSYISIHTRTRSSTHDSGKSLRASVKLTNTAQKTLYQLHNDWLESRNFNPEYIYKKYRLMCVGPIGKLKYRLIIPIYLNRQFVAYISRDVTEKAQLKYLAAKDEDCIVPVKHTLYNYDNANDTAIVVEGATDVWRIGDGAIATLGVVFTPQQIFLLSKFSRVFIMYDSKAEGIGEKLAYQASSVVPFVELIEMSEGDPADMSEVEVRSLRRELFGKIA